jgi:hypothetical protein
LPHAARRLLDDAVLERRRLGDAIFEEQIGVVRARGDRRAEHAIERRGAEVESVQKEPLRNHDRVHGPVVVADGPGSRETVKAPPARARAHGLGTPLGTTPCRVRWTVRRMNRWTAPGGARHNRPSP